MPMPNSVADRFITKIRGYKKIDRVRGIRASVYTTYNEVWIYVLYSGGTKQGKYWFGIDTRNVEDWRHQKSVIFCFICGDEETVAFVPDDKLVEWFSGVEPNRKGQWMITIALKKAMGEPRTERDHRSQRAKKQRVSILPYSHLFVHPLFVPGPSPQAIAAARCTGFSTIGKFIRAERRPKSIERNHTES